MKSSLPFKKQIEMKENGRAIAQAMRAEKVQHEKNMARYEKRSNTMLEKAAQEALSGGIIKGRERLLRP